MNGLTVHRGQYAPLPQYSAPPHYSALTIPAQLVVDLHDTPLAIGLYSLTARQYIIAKAPIPLSTPDVLRYDPTLSRGAVIRAFARLVGGGWLIETKRPGGKSRYVPSWGYVNNIPRPWQIGAPLLGRPRRQIVVRLDQRLLDTYMGKITLHPIRTALIERYVTLPLLSLADIGAYVLCLAGQAIATEPLLRLGLVRDGQAQPIASDQRILALASQHSLEANNATMLTDRGLRRIGYIFPLAGGEAEAQSQPLFFVPKHMIGSLIGPMIDSMIGQTTAAESACTASGQQATDGVHILNRSHGLKELHELQEESPPTPQNMGGGEQSQSYENWPDGGTQKSEDCVESRHRIQPTQARTHHVHDGLAPDIEAARALAAINILPEQVAELSDIPLVTIQAAIRDGQARLGIRDLAGWVVHLLRNVRDHGWHIQPPSSRPDSPEALRIAFARYAAEQEGACGLQEELTGQGLLASDNSIAEAMLGNAEKRIEVPMHTSDPEQLLAGAQASPDLDQLWSTVLGTMRAQISRQEFNSTFRDVVLQSIGDGGASIGVPDVRSKECLENRYLGVLRELLEMHLKFPIQVRIKLQGVKAVSAGAGSRSAVQVVGCEQGRAQHRGTSSVEHTERPTWISAEQWERLPRMLRAALIGSTLEQGVVRGKTEYLTQLLQIRYAAELAVLRNEQTETEGGPIRS